MIFSAPRLYAISNRKLFPSLAPEVYLERLFSTPAEVVQWREKDLAPAENAPFGGLGARLAAQTGKAFLLNSDFETALAQNCSGVHLVSTQDPLPALRARIRAGRPDFLIGKSVHSLTEALTAEACGVDYVMLGPVFPPLSKTSPGPALGLKAFEEACRRLSLPVAAVGGIEGERVKQVFQAGAWAAAGITWAVSAGK